MCAGWHCSPTHSCRRRSCSHISSDKGFDLSKTALRREQGFANGLALQSNSHMLAALPPFDQRELLGSLTDMALVSLAGNLRSFPIEDHTGRRVLGAVKASNYPGFNCRCRGVQLH